MTSIIKLEALSGAYDESPPCYLLQVDEFRFLLDCGWNEHFDREFADQLAKHVKHIDAVLLSHPDAFHLGALPYLVGKCGLNCPVYATVPVYKMGQMFLYDLHQSRHNYEEFTLFSLDDIDAAFGKITQLKYNQSVALKGKGLGITIVPQPAGHMIGGTIWRITKDGEEEIVYAMDFNHKQERHLNGCQFENISKPSLLIIDAYNAMYTQLRRKQRDEELMTTILKTLRNGGNVLISVDTAGRVLELAHMLDQFWRAPDSGLMAYSLALLNTVSPNVIEFAKSQIEWMSSKITKLFEGQRNNPFHFRHLQLCYDMAMLTKVREPRVILASQPDLECGFARELFLSWATNPKNSIILTQRSSQGTLAHELMSSVPGAEVTLEVKQRIPLEGEELEEYLRVNKKPDKVEVKDEDSDSEEEEEVDDAPMDDEDEDAAIDNIKKMPTDHDLMKSDGKGHKGGGFFKQAKKSYPMFPCHETKIKWDDYGEIINPEDYMIFDHSATANAARSGLVDGEDNKEKDVEEIPEVKETPTKCVVSVETFNVSADIKYIDFEGRSDGESLKKIITVIRPRRLILVRGTQESTEHLASYCNGANAVLNGIFTPRKFEVVDATTESHIYQVKLKDSLVSSLHFSQAKDGAELAWVEAELEMPEEESLLPEKEQTASGALELVMAGGRELLPTLKTMPSDKISSHVTIFVNELKLSDFKQVLMKSGIQAEFSGGVLYCNNQVVAVRRNEAGRIHLEGTVCDDYFKVRELLYQQYAVV